MITAYQAAILGGGLRSVAFPPPPTREYLLSGTNLLQGVIVNTQQYGMFNAFGPELNMIESAGDRLSYMKSQSAAGTSVCLIGWAGFTYTSGDGFTYPVPGPGYRWVDDLPGFCDRLAEIVKARLFRGGMISLPGDGHTGVDGNPFGYQYVMANAPKLVNAMKTYPGADLTKYFILQAGFDGTIWNWTEAEVYAYGALMRSLLPSGYLAVENPAGVTGPSGEGDQSQYNGPMRTFDVILQEFAFPPMSNPSQMTQVGARMLGPHYVRPSWQDPNEDPDAPYSATDGRFLLANGTPRGPYHSWGWEFDTYGWVRGMPLDMVLIDRARIRSIGWSSVG